MNIRENLKAYLDNELSESQRAEVEAELAKDQVLRDELEGFKQLGTMLKEFASQEEAIPVKGASEALKAVRKKRIRPLSWQIGGLAAIAACLVIATPILINRTGTSATRSMEEATAGVVADGMPGNAAGESMPMTEAPMAKTKPVARSQIQGAELDRAKTYAKNQQQLVKTASIQLKVADVAKAQSDVKQIATSLNGFVSSSSTQNFANTNASADLTIRVPSSSFDIAIEQLGKLGEIESSSSNAEDVTLQITDGEARLKVKKAEEESYITMLRATQKVGEMLEVKERLGQVREEIESLNAQNLALNNMATYSTISVSLFQRPKIEEKAENPGWEKDSWANAINGLKSSGRVLGTAAINLFVYSPIWLPIVLIAVWLIRRSRISQK